jgi:hypothetical protein
VTIRKHTGDWTKDHEAKPLTDAKTDRDGTARFALADGYYYVEIDSDRELPYLEIPVRYKGSRAPTTGSSGSGRRRHSCSTWPTPAS